jgi:hypothetical protein
LFVVKLTAPVAVLQKYWSPGLLTCPAGLIVRVNVFVDPTQLVPAFVKVGVTTMVPDICAVVALVAVNEMFPDPLAARPMLVLLFVHAYEVTPPVLTVA